MKKTEQNPVTEMEQLAASIQEGTKNTLRDLLSEAVGKFIKEEIDNEDDDEQGGLTFEIEKGRLSFRLTAPYSTERRKAARRYARENNNLQNTH